MRCTPPHTQKKRDINADVKVGIADCKLVSHQKRRKQIMLLLYETGGNVSLFDESAVV